MDTLISGQATPHAFEGKPPESFYATIVASLDNLASDEFKDYTDQLSAAVEGRESTNNQRDIVKALKAALDVAKARLIGWWKMIGKGPNLPRRRELGRYLSRAVSSHMAKIGECGLHCLISDRYGMADDPSRREAVDQTSAVAERDPSVSERLGHFVEERQASSA